MTAGVGPFNSSLITPFINSLQSLAPDYPYQVLPFTCYAAVYALVLNPLLSTRSSPVSCKTSNCTSYLLSGGLSMVAPWVERGHPDYPLVKIRKTPSIQVDFSGPTDDSFSASDCDLFGQTDSLLGIRLCVTELSSGSGLLRAGRYPFTGELSQRKQADGARQGSLFAPTVLTAVSVKGPT